MTYFPNDFVLSQRQANDSINEHLPQVISNCTDALKLALCRSFYPECPQFGNASSVCSSSCGKALECAGLDTAWNNSYTLQCGVYPNENASSVNNTCGYDAGGKVDCICLIFVYVYRGLYLHLFILM